MNPRSVSPQLLAARWYAGQSWRVEYLRSVPSPAKSSSPPPRPAEWSVWRYEVMKEEAWRGAVQVAAVEEGGQGKLELWFDSQRLMLRRVVSVAGNRRIDLIIHPGSDPYFGWSPAYPVIFDWPRIPDVQEEVARKFANDDGAQVEEKIHFLGPNRFEVTMTLRRKVDEGFLETKRSTQSWTVGSPWWSTAAIVTEYNIDGEASSQINIAGRLMS